jgi:hypothetical protein
MNVRIGTLRSPFEDLRMTGKVLPAITPEDSLFYSQFVVDLALQREIKDRRAFHRLFEPQELRVGFQVFIDFFVRGDAVPGKGGPAEAVGVQRDLLGYI